jgi:hypothetical protein
VATITEACETSEDSINSLFAGYDDVYLDDTYYFSKNFSNETYAVSYGDGEPVASIVQDFDKEKFKEMKATIKNLSTHSEKSWFRRYYTDGKYIYLVSKHRLIKNQMLISVTRN